MKVFRDRVTHEDMISDCYPHEIMYDGAILKFKATWGIYSDNEDVVLAGSNASAEDAPEEGGALQEGQERRMDIVHKFALHECDYMDKSAFKEWLKESRATWEKYVKDELLIECENKKMDKDATEAAIAEGVKKWKGGVQAFAGMIIKNWKNCSVYYDKNFNFEASKCFYIGDETSDNIYYIKCLMYEEKC